MLRGKNKKTISIISCMFLFALLLSCAKQDSNKPLKKTNELIILSPHPEDMIDFITKEFHQRTGIKITVIREGTGELMQKVANLPYLKADVFWGGGIDSLETIKDHFLFYESEVTNAIYPTYKSPHSLWHPYSVLPMVIIYNKSLIPPDLWPKSWDDLLNPFFKNRIIMADPQKSGSAFTILTTLLYVKNTNKNVLFGGRDFLNALIGQLGEEGITQNSNAILKAVSTGDCFAGISFEDYAITLEKLSSNVAYIYPSEGTSLLPDGVALLKNAENLIEAKAFIDFVLDEDVQKLLLPRWQRRSVRTELEKSNKKIMSPLIQYPTTDAANSRELILYQWLDLLEKNGIDTHSELNP